MKIASVEEIREMDRTTREDFHVPGSVLMENAALRVVDVVVERFGPLLGKRVYVVCGQGNNGGDGMAIARHLSARFGAQVTIWLSGSPESFQGDAATSYDMAKSFGLQFCPAPEMEGFRADLIIDALFGTGIQGGVHGPVAAIIQRMNESGKPIVAVDIPSGLNADQGTVEGAVVQATITVTFGLLKYGLLEYPGADFVGELLLADIGLPRSLQDAPSLVADVIEREQVGSWLPTRRNGRDVNKGTFGHVLIFAGSTGFSGAAILVAEAAARAGAGLVTLVVPEGIHDSVRSRVSPVVMTRGLAQSEEGTLGKAALGLAMELWEKSTSLAIGPGLGEGDGVAAFVRGVISQCPVPIVVDAGAISRLAEEPGRGQLLVKGRSRGTILTPHPGEMANLLAVSTHDIQIDRRASVMKAAHIYGCVAILKGARTLVADSEGRLYLNRTGNPGMATGGSGDVLTGVLAALLAKGLDPLKAAAAGVYLHGLAGDLAQVEQGGATGLLATDLISHLPLAIARCQQMNG